jgi:hypothetical protein
VIASEPEGLAAVCMRKRGHGTIFDPLYVVICRVLHMFPSAVEPHEMHAQLQ